MANMTMAKKSSRPIWSRGTMAFIIDFNTTWRPERQKREREGRERKQGSVYFLKQQRFYCNIDLFLKNIFPRNGKKVKEGGKNKVISACNPLNPFNPSDLIINKSLWHMTLVFRYLLGIPDTSFRGRSTLTARSVRRSKSEPTVARILLVDTHRHTYTWIWMKNNYYLKQRHAQLMHIPISLSIKMVS